MPARLTARSPVSAKRKRQALVDRIRESVPKALRGLPVWLMWRASTGRKIPIYADGTHRRGQLDSPEDRSELVVFENIAAAFVAQEKCIGLGFALGEVPEHGIHLSGIDLDDVRQGTGFDPRAQQIFDVAGSYTEYSPSGNGVHVLGLGDIGTTKVRHDGAGLEIYSGARYFTVTGDSIRQGPLADLSRAAAAARKLFPAYTSSRDTSAAAEPGFRDVRVFPDWSRDSATVAAALAYLDPADYGSWLRYGMAIHLACGGDETGFEIWHRWSGGNLTGSQPGTYKGEEDCRKHWRSFRHKHDRLVTLGTLFADAKAAGFVFPALAKSALASTPQDWPKPLADEALHGLFGDIVRAVEADTEADPAAILLQAIVAFGSLVGREPHYRVEGDRHSGNLFLVLVGPTAKARKGTSWGRVRQIFEGVAGWTGVVNGLSSGEGLIQAINDLESSAEVTKGAEREAIAADARRDDCLAKRSLVMESEFAQVLRQAARAGNILSPILRSAWDGSTLMVLTRKNPLRAEGAHISIIAHVTETELRTELTETDAANGFANRFIYQSVRRSKRLPFGGRSMSKKLLKALASRIEQAVIKSRTRTAIEMSEEARTIWVREYDTLSEGHTGLLGAVTARAEAQVVRLALIYALADDSKAIEGRHLLAALAVWKRAEQSARYIFGSALGNSTADDLLRSLRAAGQAGMTRTEIRDSFHKHARAGQINAALDILKREGLAGRIEQSSEGGRPAELWKATQLATEATKATEVGGSGLSSHRSLPSQPRKPVRVARRSAR